MPTQLDFGFIITKFIILVYCAVGFNSSIIGILMRPIKAIITSYLNILNLLQAPKFLMLGVVSTIFGLAALIMGVMYLNYNNIYASLDIFTIVCTVVMLLEISLRWLVHQEFSFIGILFRVVGLMCVDILAEMVSGFIHQQVGAIVTWAIDTFKALGALL